MGRDKQRQTGRFIMVNHSLLNSPAFIALPPNAQRLFFDLRLRFNGGNNGDINAALSELRHRGWRSPSTLAKAVRQLEALGFIVRTRQTPGVEYGSRLCNLYAFTDQEVRPMPHKHIPARPASFDYAKHKTLGECRALVRQSAAPRKPSLQTSERIATKIGAKKGIDATESDENAQNEEEFSVATSGPRTDKKPRRINVLQAAQPPAPTG